MRTDCGGNYLLMTGCVSASQGYGNHDGNATYVGPDGSLASFSTANGSLYCSLARLMCLLGFALLGIYPSASSLHTCTVERANSQWGIFF